MRQKDNNSGVSDSTIAIAPDHVIFAQDAKSYCEAVDRAYDDLGEKTAEIIYKEVVIRPSLEHSQRFDQQEQEEADQYN